MVLWDVQEEENQKTEKLCRSFGVQTLAQKVNVGDNAAVYAAASRVQKEIGHITILVNNVVQFFFFERIFLLLFPIKQCFFL